VPNGVNRQSRRRVRNSANSPGFVPAKLNNWFTDRAGLLLVVIVVLALLRGLGFLTIVRYRILQGGELP